MRLSLHTNAPFLYIYKYTFINFFLYVLFLVGLFHCEALCCSKYILFFFINFFFFAGFKLLLRFPPFVRRVRFHAVCSRAQCDYGTAKVEFLLFRARYSETSRAALLNGKTRVFTVFPRSQRHPVLLG